MVVLWTSIQAQEAPPVKVSVVAQIHQPVEVVVTQAPAPQMEDCSIPEASSEVIAEPQPQVAGLYFSLSPFHTLVCGKECGLRKLVANNTRLLHF